MASVTEARAGHRLALLYREPMLWFVLIGGLLFAADLFLARPDLPVITLTQQQLDEMQTYREELLGRKLTAEESEALADNYIAEEILLNEAIAFGLHRQDPRVRKRLIAKMNFLLAEAAPEPSAAELEALRQGQPKRYMLPKTVSFEHVFFEDSKEMAAAALPALRTGTRTPAELGDRFWLGQRMEHYSAHQLFTVLGMPFAEALKTLPPGEWAGPLQSARGWHLVRLIGFYSPEPLPPAELNRRLQADWAAQYVLATRAQRVEELKSGYIIDMPRGFATP